MAFFRLAEAVLSSGRTRRVRQALRAVVVVALAGVIASCAPVFRNHGYVPAEADLAAIEVGVDTRDSVAGKIGRPGTSGLLNDVGWFYVQSRYRHFGPREPREIERQVLVVSFAPGEAGTVSNVERFGLQDGKVIAISRRITESNIRGIGFIRQLLGSFGNIRAEDVTG